jgi:effector-binding domain-containing protein
MKALKVVGIILLILVVLFFVIALFLPSKLHMEESMVINEPARLLFKQVNNFKNWEKWSPWQESDPAMEITYKGNNLGVGASYFWISKVHGDGEMTILESKPYEMIRYKRVIMERGTAYSDFFFEETDGGTKVTWTTDIPKLTYPVERYFGLLMPGMMRDFFIGGLENLAEASAVMEAPVEVKILKTPERKVVAILDSCIWSEFEPKMEELFGELMSFMGSNRNITAVGPPYTSYIKWDEENQFSVFEAGIPVDKEARSRGRVTYKVLPESRAVMGTHYGSYDDLGKVYLALEEYVKEFGYEEICCPYEVYVIDKTSEPDTTKWKTDVYFLIK